MLNGAMKAAFRISGMEHPGEDKLLKKTGQQSVMCMANAALASMACNCIKDWRNHPLTAGRIEVHRNVRVTRQAGKMFPPQSPKGSLVTKMVEIWESLPESIRENVSKSGRRRLIKAWAQAHS